MSLTKNPEKTFAIVADDLTGANDTGIQFLKKGLKTMVILDLEVGPELVSDVDVIVFNTDSRLLEPEQAYGQTKQMGFVLKNLGVSHVYKKIDSTLRGNIGAEIEALLEILEAQACFLTPAFPIYDRTVQEGNLYLKGVPIYKTGVAADPAFHMKTAFIPDLLSQQTPRKIGVIFLEIVRRGVDSLLQAFNRSLVEGVQIFVLDAVVQGDLKFIARALAKSSISILICGSAGLALEIPEAFNLQGKDGREGEYGSMGVWEYGRNLPQSSTPTP
ncbi:MAG: four-carbon acid sugar kinase family protein, partial [Nitrospira sp.]|nr:four-carbon acid sugar kinase family protein [Nitrospira sp.]